MKIKKHIKSKAIEKEMGFEFDKLELIGYVEMCFDVLFINTNKIFFFLKLMIMKFCQLLKYKIMESIMAG